MGSINLNSIVYNERLTKETILDYVSQEQIYSFYIGEQITSGTKLHSPLREDNVPSFVVYYHKTYRNTLMFYDFATKDSGDCIIFVASLFGLGYKEALMKIAFDFGLSDINITATKQILDKLPKLVQKEPVKIGIKRRNWKLRDKDFWNQFGITKHTLDFYNVHPIEYVFFNGNAVKTERLAYAYIEFKDEEISYKIYQPYADKRHKWINNANYSVHQGYTQLPPHGDFLIITKALKDVMSLRDVMGITSVGLQSESVMMKDSVMAEYKTRFKKVICLFDNDEAGIKLSKEFSEAYDVPYILIPKINENVTDFSDMVKEIGIDKSIDEFEKVLKNEIKQR
jgi:5S rRNA maturation endonuclease (ribonuclease M5)